MKNSKFKIVLTVDQKDLLQLNQDNVKNIDFIEIRLDLFTSSFVDNRLENILRALGKPVIFTSRKTADSSLKINLNISTDIIYRILEKFNSKENFLDIELNSKNIFENFENNHFSIIYSYHDFKKTISKKKMQSFIENKLKSPAFKIFKFAVTPKNPNELAVFMEDLRELSKYYSVAGIAMGELGMISRVFGDLYGSSLTYCCLEKPKAPGQINLQTLSIFRKNLK